MVQIWKLVLPPPGLRQAEFARSICAKKVQRPPNFPVHYLGLFRDGQKDVADALAESVYTAWDNASTSPPKTRTREAASEPRLGIVLWQDQRPVFPSTLLTRFANDSDHHAEMLKLKAKMEELWPSDSLPSTSPATNRRAVGSPDFTGVEQLDISREVSLSVMKTYDEFNEERPLVAHGQFQFCTACIHQFPQCHKALFRMRAVTSLVSLTSVPSRHLIVSLTSVISALLSHIIASLPSDLFLV